MPIGSIASPVEGGGATMGGGIIAELLVAQLYHVDAAVTAAVEGGGSGTNQHETGEGAEDTRRRNHGDPGDLQL